MSKLACIQSTDVQTFRATPRSKVSYLPPPQRHQVQIILNAPLHTVFFLDQRILNKNSVVGLKDQFNMAPSAKLFTKKDSRSLIPCNEKPYIKPMCLNHHNMLNGQQSQLLQFYRHYGGGGGTALGLPDHWCWDQWTWCCLSSKGFQSCMLQKPLS